MSLLGRKNTRVKNKQGPIPILIERFGLDLRRQILGCLPEMQNIARECIQIISSDYSEEGFGRTGSRRQNL